MSFNSLIEEEPTEVLFEAVEIESSVEPPMEEWSSLIIDMPEENKKKILYEQGLYHPGSGNVCTKYIPMSDSSVFRHLYYNYPAVVDPGIKKALLQPEQPIIYPNDGQDQYLALCKAMGQSPIRTFHKGLLEETIDLRYYCVDPKGVFPMAMALKYNKTVKVLNLTDNFLDDDACYHLGDMLIINSTLQEINLSGCRIRASGAKRLFAGLTLNRTLKSINLNKNMLGDDGVDSIAKSVFQGLDVQKLYLSYNSIGGKSANALAEAFETHCKFVVLDLSWNNLIMPGATFNLLTALGESKTLQELNISWNSLTGARIGTAIRNVLRAPNLKFLNISNNRLSGEAITNFLGSLATAKKLNTLDLSYNPMSPDDALEILKKMKTVAVKVQKIYLENVFVTGEFLELLRQIKELKFRKNFNITYGGVVAGFKAVGPDPRELVLNRAEYLSKKPKKRPVDIALVVLQLEKDKNIMMSAKDFGNAIHSSGAPMDDDLINEIVNIFAAPSTAKSKIIDIRLLVDYIKRKWPERKLPPTPPPEPEPEPIPVVEEPKGKKDKKKK